MWKMAFKSRAMKYADDLNAFQYLPVKNDIPAYGETSQAYFEFVTRSAYVRFVRPKREISGQWCQ